ncbi:hypothetical protein LV85_03481 [Algoriphagus chordae]|uniref:Uncharacterized protein n=1 Tax=Algoriphagus chordae TaxID=237019 RepID=A0A2W7QYA1_9BACT|nr:hypothetical protein LV85_03481 [Algoriphagus chordae]
MKASMTKAFNRGISVCDAKFSRMKIWSVCVAINNQNIYA